MEESKISQNEELKENESKEAVEQTSEEKKEEVPVDPVAKEFSEILDKENFLLDNITAKQIDLRKVLTKKDWDAFVPLMNELNHLTDMFQEVDTTRDKLQSSLSETQIAPFKNLIGILRDKLLKCRIETKVIEDYVSTTREFINTVVKEAIPHERNKNYTKSGTITDSRKRNILIDFDI